MSMDDLVTVTTYETEPVKIITVPAHYSFNEICEAIRSELGSTTQDNALQLPNDDISTIIVASGEFPLISPYQIIDRRPIARLWG